MNASKKEIIAILTFRLAEQLYALPIMNVLEVTAMMSLSTIPNAPNALIGIANRRGEALAMLDLRIAFHLEASAPDISTLFIVAQTKKIRVGLVVDEIFQVKYIHRDAIQATQNAGHYITHIISHNNVLYQQINLDTLISEYLAPIN